MACDQKMRQTSRAGRTAGIPAVAGRVAFETGVVAFRAARAGWQAQRFVDKTMLDSPIPTSFGLLALAGGAGGSLTVSVLRAAMRAQRVRLAHRRRLLARTKFKPHPSPSGSTNCR